MKAVIKNAVKGKWIRKEDKWGEFVVTAPVTKYDFKERAVIDTQDVFKISVGGREYQGCLDWADKTTKDIEVSFYGEAFQYQGEWKYGVKVSFERFVSEKENPFKGKEPAKKDESEDDLPF